MGRFELPPQPAGPGAVSALRESVEEWAAGRSALIRLPLLLYLAYVFVQHLRDPLYGSLLFGGVTFGIHELGHIVFAFLPLFGSIAAGSFAQLAAPLLCAWIFLRQPDYFGVGVVFAWLSYSLFNLATYVGDAGTQELPLIGPGSGDPIHDWNYILSALGLLRFDRTFESLMRLGATVIGAAALIACAWMCVLMWQLRGTRKRSFS